VGMVGARMEPPTPASPWHTHLFRGNQRDLDTTCEFGDSVVDVTFYGREYAREDGEDQWEQKPTPDAELFNGVLTPRAHGPGPG